MMDSLRKEFSTPPLAFRGAPFWSWNDHLQPAELTRQVKDMQAHGMGGFFMHSREGLETPYMGKEWIECIRATVDAARETGMGAWLYDEDRWPSGFAGGLVPARGGDAYRMKIITLEVRDSLPEDESNILALFAGQVEGNQLNSVRRLDTTGAEAIKMEETCLVFRRAIAEPSEWFNNDAYSDNMNPDSVAAFLDITYEAYRAEVGEEFGKAIPGIFTDEPNIFSHHLKFPGRALPWTDDLPVLFQQRRGCDLLEQLPWLFFNGSGAPKARHDFWHSISERFTEAYSKQIGEWCEKNGLAFTGHYLYEQEMGDGIVNGGAIMPHYRHQHVPGIDMLTEQNREFLTIKQCSSVANQFDRPRVLSETYGCSGWEFTFEGQKWNGDWQYVLGVNLRCQHLALYSLRGCRKRDYPPAFNYNTTWWPYNGVVEDYFARIGRVLSEGHAVRDVLVLHPVSTGWSMLGDGPESRKEVNDYSARLNEFVQALLATHYDFDFGDEQILANDSQVEGGMITVGRAPYRLVIVPPEMRTLLSSTVDLLDRYLDSGGRVIAFQPLPEMVDALPSDQLATLWKHPGVTVLPGVQALNAMLETAVPRRISLLSSYGQQAPHLLYMQRDLGDGSRAFFIVNNARDEEIEVSVSLEGPGFVDEWDPLTGKTAPVSANNAGGLLTFQTHFGPAGSRLYIISPNAVNGEEQVDRFPQRQLALNRKVESGVQFIGPSTPFTRTGPNVLTLDRCQYRLGENGWSAEMDVWRAQDEARGKLAMRPNFYNGLPQRYRWALEPHPADGTPLALRFQFAVNDVPDSGNLLTEDSSRYQVSLNGEQVSNTQTGWYLDRAFHTIPLPALRKGMNELILTCAYTNYMEIEDIYIIGDFGVSVDRVIEREPERLHFGDWTTQGYPHYPGGMVYKGSYNLAENRDPLRPIRLYLDSYSAVHISVSVNGHHAGHIPWRAANGLNIAPFLVPGSNDICIEVVSSPRNMLGPLHRAPEHEPWTDWRSFRRTDATYTPDYVLWPWGLFGQLRIVAE